MNPLESRKQLLIAESELNRVQLTRDLAAMRAEAHSFADRAKPLGAIASSAAALMTGLAAYRCGKTVEPDPKPTWVQNILKGAGLASSLWSALRPSEHDPKDKSQNT